MNKLNNFSEFQNVEILFNKDTKNKGIVLVFNGKNYESLNEGQMWILRHSHSSLEQFDDC